MRRYLGLSVALSNTKSNMLVDSALPERIQMATMKRERPVPPASVSAIRETSGESVDDIPWNVSQAAKFLGVSPQTIYLWVERKQIPHLRVMGRNIRFLRADLERFRASFRREPEESQGTSR
jgi:excisionase family DNA binding protein